MAKTPPTGASLWDPVVLARVRHLHLKARFLTRGWLSGAHRSRRTGQAIEFADYQEYQPGMDLRGLDWKVWGRTDRYVVKRYEVDTELPCHVVLDMSGDMGTGHHAHPHARPDLEGSKAGLAITLAATTLFALSKLGEPVGLEIIGNKGTAVSLRPRGGRSHLMRLFLELAKVEVGGVAQLSQALARVGGRIRRRGWVAVISDGMEEPDTWLPSLAGFARRGADCRFVHLFDHDERTMNFQNTAIFYSPEDGSELAIDPAAAAEPFATVVEEYIAEIRSGVTRWGGRYLQLDNTSSLEPTLQHLLRDLTAPLP